MSSESNTPYRENGSALYSRITELEKELNKYTMKPKYEYSLSSGARGNLAGTLVVFLLGGQARLPQLNAIDVAAEGN